MHRKYWVIPTMLVLAASLAACSSKSKSPTATPTASPTTAATTAATKEATTAPTQAATTAATKEATTAATQAATTAATKQATTAATQAATTAATPEATTAAGAQSSAGQTEVQVQMINTTFDPKEITVKAGTKVTWTNNDSTGHTVTSGTRGNPSGLFDSGNVAPGQTFSFVFDTPGTYNYYCQYHQGMDGTVIVQ